MLTDSRLPDRFWSKVDPTPSGCWIWTAYLNGKGYGKFKWEGRMAQAHRVSYEVLVGPIPDGMEIDHTCRTRACVNPTHLEVVEHRVNVERAPSAVVWRNRDATHCGCGEPLVTINRHGKRGCRPCANERNRQYRLRKKAA